MVTSGDVMILEGRLKGLTRMRIGLRILRGLHNSEHENPVMFTLGSNSFMVDREDLACLMDLLDTDEPMSPSRFLEEYLAPFIRRHAK